MKPVRMGHPIPTPIPTSIPTSIPTPPVPMRPVRMGHPIPIPIPIPTRSDSIPIDPIPTSIRPTPPVPMKPVRMGHPILIPLDGAPDSDSTRTDGAPEGSCAGRNSVMGAMRPWVSSATSSSTGSGLVAGADPTRPEEAATDGAPAAAREALSMMLVMICRL